MNHEILKRVIFDQHELIKSIQIVDRDIELEKDANYVLVGIRRAGKSTLMYKRVKDLIATGVKWEQIIYINFDDERLLGFKMSDFDDILLTAEELTREKHYFYFDEIQNIDGWEHFARRIADQKMKVDITGSNAKMLSSEIGEKLGGRYIPKEIMPYSFKEFLRAKGIEKDEFYSIKEIGIINVLLDEFLNNGGFPECIQYKNKKEYISSIYQKILLGDIITHNKIRKDNEIKLLVKKVVETTCQDVSYSKLQNMLTGIGYKISKEIIIDYCNYCKESFLMFSLSNYYASFVDKESNPKFYLMDNGIMTLFGDERPTALLENIVALFLYRKNKEHLYYLKSEKNEVDFYLSDEKIAIQAYYSIDEESTYKREVKALVNFAKKANEPQKLIIVTHNEEKVIQEDGFKIEVIPLRKFLLA